MLKTVYVQLDDNETILDISEVPKDGYRELILDVNDNMEDEVVKFIELIKGSSTYNMYEGNLTGLSLEEVEWGSTRSIMKEMFLFGCCGRFSMILKSKFPHGESYALEETSHIITKINDKFYDIEGDVTDRYKDEPMSSISDYEICEEECVDNNYSFTRRGPII